ncbi:hypothetical protein UFOVP122_59 [uncultured Caudovirales phage]|uniref:Uncharacterized protein n=1 Tax=uncultured Caudovirales phage TaxID=2100421 RepID=A0A6J5L9F6_9CAUD|nr:hypothetical protein UFOVP122_59 [uncultured Caudovirales phage]
MIHTADYPANWNPVANDAADSSWQGVAMSMFAKGGRVGTMPFAIKVPAEHFEHMAKGGLASQAKNVANAGVGGDTMVVHINKDEYQKLREEWGDPTINPHTGMPQFTPFWKQSWFAPVAAIAGTALIASGYGAPIGNFLLGDTLAGTSLASATGVNALGSATLGNLATNTVLGAGVGALTGGAKGALTSGLLGAGGTIAGSALGNYLTPAPTGDVHYEGNVPVADTERGGQILEGSIKDPNSGGIMNGIRNFVGDPSKMAATAITVGGMMGGGNSQPEDAGLATAQKPADANLSRHLGITPLTRNRIPNLGDNFYAYGKMPEQSFFRDNSVLQQAPIEQDPMQQDTTPSVQAARGGPLSHYVQGGGTGRSDSIDAKLSDGEYIIDAETVALLGDGSSKAGAQKLDQFRANIRKQKGKALAQGKISPDAHDAERYLMGGRA